MKEVIGIRCHEINDEVITLYNALLTWFESDQVFVVVDASKKRASRNLSLNILEITTSDILEMNLPPIINWGWQCGDYFVYMLANATQPDFLWLIEPDVAFCGDTVSKFFNEFKDRADDFLAVRHGKRESSWFWSKTINVPGMPIFGCAFPLVRFSKKSVSYLQEKREILAGTLDSPNRSNWPNDEAFVSSFLEAGGFFCSDIAALSTVSFSNFSTTIPMLKDSYVNFEGVVHPALNWDEFKLKFQDRVFKAYYAGRRQDFLQKSLYGLSSVQMIEVMDGLVNYCIDIKDSLKR